MQANPVTSPSYPLQAAVLRVFSSPARRTTAVRASGTVPPGPEERRSWGRKVDEGMVVLRRRIQERRIADDANLRREDQDGWMEWETRCYATRYASDVCDAVGAIQRVLLRTRPGAVLGLLGLLLIALPASAAVGVLRLVAFLSAAAAARLTGSG